MKTCQNCGAEMPETAKVCGMCRADFNTPSFSPQSVQPAGIKFHPQRIALIILLAICLLTMFLPFGDEIPIYADGAFLIFLLFYVPIIIIVIVNGDRSKTLPTGGSVTALVLGAIAMLIALVASEIGGIGLILNLLSDVAITVIAIVNLARPKK